MLGTGVKDAPFGVRKLLVVVPRTFNKLPDIKTEGYVEYDRFKKSEYPHTLKTTDLPTEEVQHTAQPLLYDDMKSFVYRPWVYGRKTLRFPYVSAGVYQVPGVTIGIKPDHA